MRAWQLFKGLIFLVLLPLLVLVIGKLTFMQAAEQVKPLSTDECGPISTDISTDTTWLLANSPYTITSDVTVNAGVTLTIEPGVVVKVEDEYDDLVVNGRLVAQGTEEQPIVFTSLKDDAHHGDTNRDGSTSSPGPGNWGSIILSSSSSGNVLEHTWIGYGGSFAAFNNLTLHTSDATIRNNVIAWSGHTGIRITGVDAAHPIELTANTFLSNTEWAVYTDPPSDMAVDVTLVDNTSTGSDHNGFGMPETISGTVTYRTTQAFPFIIRSDVTIREGAELTFTPGTVVKFRGLNENLFVGGRLVAEGTEEQPIIFTSLKDDAHGGDTNGDGSDTSPGPNDWGGIILNAPSSGSVLKHTWIGYGGWGAARRGNVVMYTSDATVQDNTIVRSGWDGIHISGIGAGPPVELTANTFISNTQCAVFAELSDMSVDVTLVDNTSVGSAYNGFGMQGTISGTVTYSTTSEFPFIIWMNDITVQERAELIFGPGTVVKSLGIGQDLVVNGRLVANGTEAQPIVFTPLENEWGSIIFNASSSGSLLEHTQIDHGGRALPGTLMLYTSDVTVRSNSIGGSMNGGIYVGSASPVIERNTIYGCDTGIHTAVGAQPILRENAILNNTQYGVHNADPSVTVDAANNYWGSPTGPYHATANPFGEGNEVSDHVLFTPWLEYPTPGTFNMDEVLISVSGGVWFHPGEVTYNRVSYANLTTQTVESAVLAFALPFAASYLESTPAGILWPERNQVFWKLGDLAPGAAGDVWIKMRYMWGLPAEYQDGSIGAIAGTNLYTDVLDVTPYLSYEPVEVSGETSLTEAQIQAERQRRPDLETFYAQAIADGYVFGAARRFDLVGNQPVTQTLLLNLDTRGVMYLSVQGDRVLASAFEGSTYTARDSAGGTSINMQTGDVTYWGDWAPTSAVQCAPSPLGGGCCMKNCLEDVLVGATVGKVSKFLGSLMNIRDCHLAIQSGQVDAIAECAANHMDVVPFLGETAGAVKCIAQCAGDPSSADCTKDRITCDQPWYDIYRWIGVPHYKVTRCRGGCYSGVPEFVTCAFGERCVPGRGCVDCGGTNVDCHNNQFNLAADPNAKYGPEGNLLPGQTVTYTITYENEGTGQAEGVFVVDELSEHFDESTLAIVGNGTYYTGSRTLSWYIGDLAPKGEVGSEGAVTFTVKLKDGLPSGTEISNQAVVHFPSVPEETPTNLVVNAVQPVVALPQSLEAESGQPIAIALQGLEASGLPLTYTVAQEPMYGVLTGVEPTLVYTSMAGFSGLDYFTFRASNGITESAPAEVSILVSPWSGDTTPPQILWTDPADGAAIGEIVTTPVLTDAVGPAYAPFVVAQFSEVISATTVTTETVQMIDGGGQPVTITVAYDGVLNRAVIVLRAPLQDDTRYQVTISQGVKDLIGNPLQADYTWSFRTGSPDNPIYLPLILRASP